MNKLISSILLLTIIVNVSTAGMRSITTMELTREMGIGINLGNTFEAFGCGDGAPEKYYTCWGSPVITEKMIQDYYKEGFRTLRVPVHWFNGMDNNYNLSKDYIAAVKQVVDWALQAKLYVIVNIHHDNDILFKNFPTNKEQSMNGYKKIWTQVAEAFKDYDDYLVLESLNEEGCWDSIYNKWGDGTGRSTAFGLLREINQAFVDIVRKSGGNNAERHLLIAGYCTDITETCRSEFKMPDDPANRMALSVHYYTPATFTILSEDADWGKASSTWGSDAEVKELNTLMDQMKNTFVSKGVPVIVGEYGCTKKNKDMNSVYKYIHSVCEACYKRGMVPVLWDTPGEGYHDRQAGTFDKKITDAMMSVK